ncbi:hypothetical protein LJPFL01_2027 [Lelliottia jeotgali]|nr:hypothetical protein LJPFL01_2027 [Lelliottia jeotgali]
MHSYKKHQQLQEQLAAQGPVYCCKGGRKSGNNCLCGFYFFNKKQNSEH